MKNYFRIVLAIGVIALAVGFGQIATPLKAEPLTGFCEEVGICPQDPCQGERIQCWGLCDASHVYCGQACEDYGKNGWRILTYCDIYESGEPCTSCL